MRNKETPFMTIAAIVSIMLAIVFAVSLPAQAQVTGDSRNVTEPTFPPVCTVLTAQQSSNSINESLLDTSRLQSAINACPVGQAVELSASGSNNAFLIQPITLNAGVSLILDTEVVVFGSVNSADYPQLSGTDWWTPLITVAPNTAPNPGSSIMGYGIIDARGDQLSAHPRLLYLGDYVNNLGADNFTAYKITLQNGAKFHLSGIGNDMTVWGIKITADAGSPVNTDGFDPSASTNVTIIN